MLSSQMKGANGYPYKKEINRADPEAGIVITYLPFNLQIKDKEAAVIVKIITTTPTSAPYK